jgi:hypothetical protein
MLAFENIFQVRAARIFKDLGYGRVRLFNEIFKPGYRIEIFHRQSFSPFLVKTFSRETRKTSQVDFFFRVFRVFSGP